MRLSLLALASLVAVTASTAIACAGSTDESVSSGDSTTADGSDEEIKAAVFGEEDNGKTVQVVSGRSFTIALSENASTGYTWNLGAVDSALGTPKVTTIPGDVSKPGSPGLKKFTFGAKAPVGSYKITIENIRPWAETSPPAKTFEITVAIVDGTQASTCGGLMGKTCGAGNYCEFTAKQACGAGDQMGTCQTKPQMCPMVVMPVCGCDGKTYNNSCEANRSGASVHTDGPCAK